MPKLRVKNGKNWEDVPIEKDSFKIGRSSESDYVIESGHVSRKHCEIRRVDGGGYELVDLGSMKGTLLNGQKVNGNAPLSPGDKIGLSRHIETVFMGDVDVSVSNTETMVAQQPNFHKDTERLMALDGPVANRAFPLNLEITRIGRERDNHVRIDVDTVSKYHAELLKEGEDFVLVDLGSANGTYVNEKRVQRQVLNPGDHIKIDWISFRFEDAGFRVGKTGTRVRNRILDDSDDAIPEELDEGLDEKTLNKESLMSESMRMRLDQSGSNSSARVVGVVAVVLILVLLALIGLYVY